MAERAGGGRISSFRRHQGDTLFTARRYASAVYAVIVCRSVRPFYTSLYCVQTTGRTEQFCHEGYLSPILHRAIRKFWYTTEIVLPVRLSVPRRAAAVGCRHAGKTF